MSASCYINPALPLGNDMDSKPRIDGTIKDRVPDLTGLVQLTQSRDPENGGYADVYHGRYAGHEVAVKVLRLVKGAVADVEKYLIRETTVWQEVDHQNVLPFLGLDKALGKYQCPALISPWCSKGTVLDNMANASTSTKFDWMLGVVEGLKHLHQEKNIVHGDLKPSNILIDENNCPLLCDFGRSYLLTHSGFTTRPNCTTRYQAPELFSSDSAFTKPSDIYALGMTFSEIWTGCKPFAHLKNDASIVLAVSNDDSRPLMPTGSSKETEALWNLFAKCWERKPGERVVVDTVAVKLDMIYRSYKLL